MTVSLEQADQQGGPRPVGIIQPTHERALCALAAFHDKRLKDAAAHIDAIPDSETLDGAWKLLLSGLIALERADFAAAEPWLQRAASSAPIWGTTAEPGFQQDAMRLAACALQKIGWIHRRRDRPDEAYRTHLAAYHLHNEHGSFEEVWETSISLGLDADLARRHGIAQRWWQIAIDNGSQASEQPERKQAVAWANLASSHVEAGQHERAVKAARTARHWWHTHDIGAVTAAQADMKLGYALLKYGESLHDDDAERAAPVLDEAVEWLTSAADALQAFGPNHATDIRWCLEQKDFAQRLRASLEP